MYTLKLQDGTIFQNADILEIVKRCAGEIHGTFEIIEKVKQPKRAKTFHARDAQKEERQEFISSLTPAQYNDVQTGVKEVKYTTKLDEDGKLIGWYLKFNAPTNEIHVSTVYKRKDEVLKAVKAMVANAESYVESFMEYFKELEISEEEFNEAFNKIIS